MSRSMNCKIRGHLRFIEINQSHNSCQHTQVDFLISIPNALADQVQSEFMSDVRVLTEKIVEMSPASLFQRFIFKFREVPGIHRCAPGPQTVIGCVTAVDVSISSSVIVAPVKPAPPKPKTRSGGLNITKNTTKLFFGTTSTQLTTCCCCCYCYYCFQFLFNWTIFPQITPGYARQVSQRRNSGTAGGKLFYRLDSLPVTQTTVSKQSRK